MHFFAVFNNGFFSVIILLRLKKTFPFLDDRFTILINFLEKKMSEIKQVFVNMQS